MAKFHVDPTTGATGQCGAGNGPNARGCPYSGDTGTENHYDTKDEAEAAGQVVLTQMYGEFSTTSKKEKTSVVENDLPEDVEEPEDDEAPAPVILTKGFNSFEVPTVIETEGYMGAKGYIGSKRPDGYVRLTEIAKLIRTDLKKATAVEHLPKNLKYSVTVKDRGINIRIKGLGKDRDIYEYRMETYGPRKRLKPEYQQIVDKINAIHKGYNYDESNGLVDHYNSGFYGEASPLTDEGQSWTEYEKATAELNKITNQKHLYLSNKEVYETPEVKEASENRFEKMAAYYLARETDSAEYDYVREHGVRNINWKKIDQEAKIKADQKLATARKSYDYDRTKD